MLFSFQSPVSPVSVPSSFLPVRSRSFPSAFDCFSVFRFRFLPVTSLWPLPAPLQGTSLYHCRFLLSSTFFNSFLLFSLYSTFSSAGSRSFPFQFRRLPRPCSFRSVFFSLARRQRPIYYHTSLPFVNYFFSSFFLFGTIYN